MGRQSRATWIGDHGGAAAVTLQLEAAGLQISGERRAHVDRRDWSRVAAADGVVSFEAEGEVYRFRANVWVVHGKGPESTAPGDDAVRVVMRSAGWRDTKVSAVGGHWSATRYSPAKAA